MQCNKVLAFYIRLSAEDADLKSSGKAESNSVTNQRKLLRDYYEQHTGSERSISNIVRDIEK